MLIKKCSKSINLCINLVFIVFTLKLIYIFLLFIYFLLFNLIINESKFNIYYFNIRKLYYSK